MRRPNGGGAIYKLSGNRRRPWAIRITTGWENGKQKYKMLGYYESKEEAEMALVDYYAFGEIEPPKSYLWHGMTDTRLYGIWCGIIARCEHENDPAYKWYGAKGVKICKEWRQDFMSFHDWSMSNRYADDLTIDRINPYGNYEPDNCRWIPLSEQAKNTRRAWDKAHGESSKEET